MADSLLALTVWQPWAELLAGGQKPVENRTWAPPTRVAGKRLAIHAGTRWSAEQARLVSEVRRELQIFLPEHLPFGAVIAVGTVIGAVRAHERFFGYRRELAIVERRVFDAGREADFERIVASPSFEAFFFGPFGWVLADLVRLSAPVPCRGAQGLWALPANVNAEVERQVARAA